MGMMVCFLLCRIYNINSMRVFIRAIIASLSLPPVPFCRGIFAVGLGRSESNKERAHAPAARTNAPLHKQQRDKGAPNPQQNEPNKKAKRVI